MPLPFAARRPLAIAVATVLTTAIPGFASSFTGADGVSWNDALNWSDTTVPASGADVSFDTNSATVANLATTLDAAFSVNSITVGSPAGAVSILAGTSGTLTIGAGGIDMSSATKDLTILVPTLGASQTWTVATGRTLSVNNGTFDLGGKTLTLAGAGPTNLTPNGTNGVTTIQNGTLDISAGKTLASVSGSSGTATLTVASTGKIIIDTGALLELSSSYRYFALTGGVQLNGGSLEFANNSTSSNTGTISGSGTLLVSLSSSGFATKTYSGAFTGSGTIALNNNATYQQIYTNASGYKNTGALLLTGNNSGFTGTFNLSGTPWNGLDLTTASTHASGAYVQFGANNSGSANATWNIGSGNGLLIGNGFSVSLGNLTGAGVVSSAQSDTATAQAITVGGLNNDGTYSGAIKNVLAVTKTGSGAWTLSGSNTYTGATTISAGSIVLGSATALSGATGDVGISGGTLDSSVASTTVGGNVTLSTGSIALNGTSIGTLALASGKNLTVSGGTLAMGIAGTSSFDSITGTGTLAITGGTLDLSSSTGINYASTYALLSGFGSGSVSGLAITGYDSTNYTASLSNAGVLSFTAVPEPASLAVLGLAGAGVLRRRRSR